jgi:hypothetical protein
MNMPVRIAPQVVDPELRIGVHRRGRRTLATSGSDVIPASMPRKAQFPY